METTPPCVPDRLALFEELRQLKVLQHFDAEQLATLLRLGDEARFSPAEVLVMEGDEGGDFGLLLAGRLEAGRETAAGRQILSRLGPGDVFGEVSFLDGLPRAGTVQACEPVRLVRFAASAVRVRVAAG